MDKPMTLSEAIRLGAMLKPQGFGANSMYAADSSCALAAACDAVGIARVYVALGHPYMDLEKRFPILTATVPGMPWDIAEEIWKRNDSHRHTREAIADWMETLENAQPKEQPCDTSLTNLQSASSSTAETS